MSDAKFTPGPWAVDMTNALGAYGVWTDVATHPGHDGAGYPSPICHMPMSGGELKLVTGSKDARNANARLIAAAPDGHEILTAIAAWWSGNGYRTGPPASAMFDDNQTWRDVVAAYLAKAKGARS